MVRYCAHFVRYAGGVLLLFALVTGPTQAQEWRQESQLMTVVEEDGALDLLLDSLSAAFEEAPETLVRRSPQDTAAVSYRTLSSRLLDKGLGLISTSHLFIQYRFERTTTGLVETVEELHFIYREESDEEDISLLYVSTDNPTVREVLLQSGVLSEVNMQTVTPFRRFLAFPRLVRKEETTLVRMAGQPVREHHERHRQQLLGYIDGLVKERGLGYKFSVAR